MAQILLTPILVDTFFYAVIFLVIAFSNLVGLLILRLLKVDHSVKITIMSLIIIFTITLVYAMLSANTFIPIWTLLVAPPVAAYLVSLLTIKILVDRNRHMNRQRFGAKEPEVANEDNQSLGQN